jgi:hypothetical protein
MAFGLELLKSRTRGSGISPLSYLGSDLHLRNYRMEDYVITRGSVKYIASPTLLPHISLKKPSRGIVNMIGLYI